MHESEIRQELVQRARTLMAYEAELVRVAAPLDQKIPAAAAVATALLGLAVLGVVDAVTQAGRLS